MIVKVGVVTVSGITGLPRTRVRSPTWSGRIQRADQHERADYAVRRLLLADPEVGRAARHAACHGHRDICTTQVGLIRHILGERVRSGRVLHGSGH